VENAAVQELVEGVISAHPPVTEMPLKTVAPPLIAKAPVDATTQAKPPANATAASSAATGVHRFALAESGTALADVRVSAFLSVDAEDTAFPASGNELWRWLTTQGYFASSIDKSTVEQIEAEVTALGEGETAQPT
jgi:hypothetical protein